VPLRQKIEHREGRIRGGDATIIRAELWVLARRAVGGLLGWRRSKVAAVLGLGVRGGEQRCSGAGGWQRGGGAAAAQ